MTFFKLGVLGCDAIGCDAIGCDAIGCDINVTWE